MPHLHLREELDQVVLEQVFTFAGHVMYPCHMVLCSRLTACDAHDLLGANHWKQSIMIDRALLLGLTAGPSNEEAHIPPPTGGQDKNQ